ncbi:MAG: 2OG-Fe(II) oxygenase [Candidatus Fonsibacter ubiquis]
MDKINNLDENVFIIKNFLSNDEFDDALRGDFNLIKLKISNIFNNQYSVKGSGRIRVLNVGEFMEPHSDQHKDSCRCGYCSLGHNNKKIYAAVIYLNDDYSGGEIFYTNKNIKHKPSANSLICHPASEEYTHEVLPVLTGERKSISFFLTDGV